MIVYLILLLVCLTFLIATIEDLKKREIYDYINFFFTFAVLIIATVHSMTINSLEPLEYVGFGLLIGFAFGSLIYYMGLWGGGDAKFLIGFSAASFYLLNFIPNNLNAISSYYEFFIEKFSNILFYIFEVSSTYILYLDIFFLLILAIHVIKEIRNTDIEHKRKIYNLLLILFFLYAGLAINIESRALLLGIGFISFLLIFFSKEDTFSSVYFKIKKPISELVVGDKPDQDILKKGKLIVKREDAKDGLNEHQIHLIEENFNGKSLIVLRKVFPYTPLIALNFIIYIFKIISLDSTNIQIISFLIKYLLISFIAGGVIGLLVLMFYFFKRFKDVKESFSRTEKIFFIINIATIIVVYLTASIEFTFLVGLPILYFFIKSAKILEKFMFIKKKPLSQIVLGDWIAQDIKVDDKIIYKAKDFKLGVEEYQLEKIKELSRTNKELKKLYVKDGIAFLPALLLGFILMFFI